MANRYRCETEWKIDGQSYVLKLTQGDLVQLEGKDALGMPLFRFIRSISEDGLGLTQSMHILSRGLRSGNNMSFPMASRVLDGVSLVEMQAPALQLLMLAIGVTTDDENEKPPPQPEDDALPLPPAISNTTT